MPTNRIAELREQAGLSRAKLAEATSIGYSKLWKIENGTLRLSFDDACTIAGALGATVDDLRADVAEPEAAANG